MLFPLFVSCPKGLENLLMIELQALGLQNAKNSPQGVYGDANITTIYQIALWSRLANRIHLILFSGQAFNSQMLYQTCEQFAWQTIFSGQHSFKVEFHGVSPQLRNEMYSAQVVKDAVADHFRKLSGTRPSIDKHDANIHIHAYLKHDQVTVSLDLVGYSLHQRGYRLEKGQAPLKENLAAALLWRMNWPEIAKNQGSFADLMCGSGTIVIEAALMACRIAPGLLRHDQAFPFWAQHQPSLWEKLRKEAKAQEIQTTCHFYGSDISAKAIYQAQENAKRAGIHHAIRWAQKPVDAQHGIEQMSPGLLVINPPYGERLGQQLDLIPTYQELGEALFHQFSKWTAGVLTSDPMLAKAIGLRSHKSYSFFNGALACQLYCIHLDANNQLKQASEKALSNHAQMLANRLQKNLVHLKKWAEREKIECYRVYDADLPEYAFAIDKYGDYLVLQEYMPPKSIPEHVAANRRLDMMTVIPQVFHIQAKQLIIKQRHTQKEKQYQKADNKNQLLIVHEGMAKFYVNLYDYLDTGLFLDHRLLRLEFAKINPMTRFLNLFCYTASASVHAALAGARTTNVDMSNTYLEWATQNFKLNQLSPSKHQFIQADVTDWLKHALETFDIIYMDTPSFSNSKRMKGTLDIQRDHVFLIKAALKRLHPEGRLYFSTHLRSFKLDESIQSFAKVQNISKKTLDVDFKRDPKIHQCFIIEPLL